MAILQRGDGSARSGHSIGIGGKRATFSRATLAAVLTSTSLGVLSLAMPAVAQVRAESVTFDIPSQPINEALVAFARQAGVRLVTPNVQFGDVRSNAVHGAYDRETALAELLRGTGVSARLENGAIVLQRSADASRATQGAAPNASEEPVQFVQAASRTSATDAVVDGSGRAGEDADRVVIVGTNIRGVYPESSPIQIFTGEDIARSGATTTEQFIQKLPQNLGTRTQYANGTNTVGLGAQNFEGVNTVDLRGLGIGTTLTLVNGRRLGASDIGRGVDISLIPLSAIERVEVLSDGASAIYGSDAIGGVVNFVLRRDFDGAETRLSHGGASDSGMRQSSLAQTFGGHWSSGSALASYNYFSASALEADDRDYARVGPGTLSPEDVRHNLFATFSQDLTKAVNVSADIGLARRYVKNENFTLTSANPLLHDHQIINSQTDQAFVNLGIDFKLSSTLNASLKGSYSKADVDSQRATIAFNRVPPTQSRAKRDTHQANIDILAMLDGSLLELPGGDLRFSLGAGVLQQDFRGILVSGAQSGRDLGRETTYAFGEIFAPLIGRGQNIPLARRLELSLAGRYTSYEDTSNPRINQEFGDSVDPKVGLLWAPLDDLAIRGTYGTSFRAPSLTELDPTGATSSILTAPVAGSPAAVLFLSTRPAADLEPETAETYSLGFDFRPQATPGFRISATYYHLDYEDRIAIAPAGSINFLATPQLLPDVMYRADSAAMIEDLLRGSTFTSVISGVNSADHAAVAANLFARPNLWIADRRLRNLTLSEQDGIDLELNAAFDLPFGDLSTSVFVTRILSYRQQGSPNSPIVSVADILASASVGPSDLRARAFLGFSREALSATLNVNYVDDYSNVVFNGPTEPIESWTTTDLSLVYDFGRASRDAEGLRFSFSVQNLFDEPPPFVRYASAFPQVNFDSANANPLGRFMSIGLTKTW